MPLVITREGLDKGLSILEESLKELERLINFDRVSCK